MHVGGSDLHHYKVVKFTTIRCSEINVVSFTTSTVVTPVASISLPICSEGHYFVFTVYVQRVYTVKHSKEYRIDYEECLDLVGAEKFKSSSY